jgi:hypothetical protein
MITLHGLLRGCPLHSLSTKEWGNQVKPTEAFTGKREELRKFLQDVELYLLVNNTVYNSDIKKIIGIGQETERISPEQIASSDSGNNNDDSVC